MQVLNSLELPKAMVEAVTERLEKLKDDIKQSIASHGLTASGKTAASLVVQSNQLEVALYGRAFFPALETGSRPWTGYTGVRCTFQEFRAIIYDWATAKGLNLGDATSTERAISAIAMKIILDGTRQRQKQRLNVYSTLVDKAAEDCATIAADVVGAQVNNAISIWGER